MLSARADRLGFSQVADRTFDDDRRGTRRSPGSKPTPATTSSATSSCGWSCSTTSATAAASGSAPTSPARSRTGSDAHPCRRQARPRRRCRRGTAARDRRAASVPAPPPSADASNCGRRRPISARRPTPGDVAMTRPHDPTDRRRSVVYLETAPRAAFDAARRAAGHARSAQRDASCRTCWRSSPARPSTSRTTTRRTTTSSRCRRPSRFDLGRYAGRPLEVGPLRPSRHRPRVLRHPLAHERVHPRVRAPLLRGHRRRGPLPARRTCRPAPTRSWPGTRRRHGESRQVVVAGDRRRRRGRTSARLRTTR